MARREEQVVDVGGHRLAVTNLDKVMYPQTGTTKADVMRYYAEIADVLLPYAAGRPVTRKRWVDGVDGPVFFQKDLETSAPDWVPRRILHHKDHDNAYPVLEAATATATLTWFAQVAALELHVPQWRFASTGEPGNPDRMVLDLDPGEGTGLPECVAVARMVRDVLDDMGLVSVPVTSGSKGIHVYAVLDGRHDSAAISALAKELAASLEAERPDLVVSTIRKADRRGKVLIDWSQNSGAKTTVAPYSLRGRSRPTVAMPRTWREITSGRLRQIELHEVAGILRRRGDAAEAMRPPDVRVDRLEAYRGKRDARRTPEPVPAAPAPLGAAAGPGSSFVIQRHRASRLHDDFRLEHDGVLVSWAIPKGVPELGGPNHLAVHVEDHPLDYAAFEGEIPEGEYGAGQVVRWDAGTYETEKWRDDEVIVTLHGSPDGGLGGVPARVALIRTDRDRDRDWLIHRMAVDAPTGATVDGPDAELAAEAAAGSAGAPPGPTRTVRPARPAKASYAPMLATASSLRDLDPDAQSAVEVKWDGVRAIASLRSGSTTLTSRTGRDMTATYPELADLGAALGGRDAVLDGEIVAIDASGRSSFGLLQQRMRLRGAAEIERAMREVPVRLELFDLLAIDGEDVASRPFRDRRALLESTVVPTPVVEVPALLGASPGDALDHARRLGLEGIVVKDLDAPYRPGRRSTAWRKIRLGLVQEVVIGGWRPGRGSRASTLGSLLLGVPDGDRLRYVGRVGSGFDARELADLRRRADRLGRVTSPLADVPAEDAADARWMTPSLVGEVAYSEVTADGRLRHPVWRGLRPDKRPADVVPESAAGRATMGHEHRSSDRRRPRRGVGPP